MWNERREKKTGKGARVVFFNRNHVSYLIYKKNVNFKTQENQSATKGDSRSD